MRRYAQRRDRNEAGIVAALEALGCDVIRADFVDLIVMYRGRNLFLEVKDGDKPPSARKLTPNQVKLQNSCKGQWDLVTNADEAISVVLRHTR